MSRGALTGHGDLDTFREVMDVNYFGMVATFEPFVAGDDRRAARHARRHCERRGRARAAGLGAYSASKSAAAKYLEALRVEMRPLGVAVVTIAPGYVRSEMTAHNPYRMPFLMDADRFAAKAAGAIERKVRYATFPWQMRIAGMLMHALPRWLYDALSERAPRKPRADE